MPHKPSATKYSRIRQGLWLRRWSENGACTGRAMRSLDFKLDLESDSVIYFLVIYIAENLQRLTRINDVLVVLQHL